MLASIHNPNVISYNEAFYDEKSKTLCIIMEYADDGDLSELITKAKIVKNRKPAQIEESKIWSIFI